VSECADKFTGYLCRAAEGPTMTNRKLI